MTDPTTRELLQEANDSINKVIILCSDELPTKLLELLLTTSKKIDAKLSAPQDEAMELVGKIRIRHTVSGAFMDGELFDLTDQEAAALIDERDRTVPRAMLLDAFNFGIRAMKDDRFGHDDFLRGTNEIAAKCHVKVEG